MKKDGIENITSQELKNEILKQNRIKLFNSKNGNNYLYDAFSQNIFPIDKEIEGFLFSKNFFVQSEYSEEKIKKFFEKLLTWNDVRTVKRIPETHLTINFSNKCNLNCSYCYRHKNNKNVMDLEKSFEVIDYANNYFKIENDEIIFSIDMTAESFLDVEKIKAFDDKLTEYENLYITESDVIDGKTEEFLRILKRNLYGLSDFYVSDNLSEEFKKIISDENLYSKFSEKEKVNDILLKRKYNPKFLDKKRLLRLNRELLETFYPNYLIHRDFQQFRIWFMSNGTNISKENIELIKRININPFWISLDGPAEIHNKNRKYYDNRDSYNDVIKNVKCLQENEIDVKISCVLTKDYPYPDKLYSFFKSLNVIAIQMCPVRNGNTVSFNMEDIEKLKDGYKRLYDVLYKEVLNDDFSSFKLLKEDLSMLALGNLFSRSRQYNRCTWGTEVVLDSKGDMYPCLYVIGDEKYLLGNISERKSASDVLKPILVNQLDKCPSCWARYLCGGTCHYNSIVKGKSAFEIDDIECSIRKYVIEESINFFIKLIENRVDINKIIKAFFEET